MSLTSNICITFTLISSIYIYIYIVKSHSGVKISYGLPLIYYLE